MGLKSYTLRLDDEVYENLRKELAAYGDPDLNISFVIRKYLRDLNNALPSLKKGDSNLLNSLAIWGMAWKELFRTIDAGGLLVGAPIVERAQAEEDDKEKYWKERKAKKRVKDVRSESA